MEVADISPFYTVLVNITDLTQLTRRAWAQIPTEKHLYWAPLITIFTDFQDTKIKCPGVIKVIPIVTIE